MVRWTLGEVWDGWDALGEVWDGSLDSWGGPGRVGDPREGPGRFFGQLGRTETGRKTLVEVRDGSEDPRGRPGRFE